MAWYLNKYECSECEQTWHDEWSCMCDDECPHCGASDHSPVESENLSAYIENNDEAEYNIYYSPPEAEHSPKFKKFATVYHLAVAKEVVNIAFLFSKSQ